MDENVEQHVARYAKLLRQAIRAAGFTVAEVERRLGIGEKGLQRILGGRVDLKVRHILAVLRVIGLSEGEFFAAATRPARGESSRAELVAAFRRLGYRGEELLPHDEPDPSQEELDRMVDEALDRALERRARHGKPLPEPPPEDESLFDLPGLEAKEDGQDEPAAQSPAEGQPPETRAKAPPHGGRAESSPPHGGRAESSPPPGGRAESLPAPDASGGLSGPAAPAAGQPPEGTLGPPPGKVAPGG
ncbi:MAG TPA: helix-turn-helix transcriptional regulator [Thermoanaerobaculia bacterium]|nr:helix-turn-helix transcriptional regulator [Thermoanaerobaculia bacterium]